MSDSTIDLVSDYEGETSSASIMGISPDSHLPPLSCNHLGSEIIHFFYDYDSERVYEVPLRKELLHPTY